MNILKQKDIEANPDNLIEYLRPFRIIISLLDKPEIGKDTHLFEILIVKCFTLAKFDMILILSLTGPLVLSDVLLEVVRAFYCYCKVMLGEDSLNSSLSGSQLNRSERRIQCLYFYKFSCSSAGRELYLYHRHHDFDS